MNVKTAFTARITAISCMLLPGLLGVISVIVLQLEALLIPMFLIGCLSLGGYSYLWGRLLRTSRGLFTIARLYALLPALLGIMLIMVASSLHIVLIGLLVVISLLLVPLTLGLTQHQRPSAS
jgi:hypothetical protein